MSSVTMELEEPHEKLVEYFTKIGHTGLQSVLQSSLQSTLQSTFNAYSLSIRLGYQYGYHSIVKGNFLEEIEPWGFFKEIENFIKIWICRVESMNKSFTDDLIGLYSEQSTDNFPIKNSLSELAKYRDKYINAKTPFNQQNLSLDQKLNILHDISTYDLTKMPKKSSFLEKTLEKLNQNFQSLKSSKNYGLFTSPDSQQIYGAGEIFNDHINGYGIMYYPNGTIWKQGKFL